MSKQYTSYHLIQRYKNIKSMIEYHKDLLSEVEQPGYYVHDYDYSEHDLIIKYYTIKIQNFEDELKEILVRKDFNEEYAISICFPIQESINNTTSTHLVGDESLTSNNDNCCIIS